MKRSIFASLTLFAHLLFGSGFVMAQGIVTQAQIEIENGVIQEGGILADEDGVVFLQIPKDTYIIDYVTLIPDDKSIMPPRLIEKPTVHHPIRNLKHLLSFEFFLQDFVDVGFADKFNFKQPQRYALQQSAIQSSEEVRTRFRYTEEELQRSPGIRVLVSFKDIVGSPAIYQYFPTEDSWYRFGGTSEIDPETNNIIFSAYIKSTGVFTIFDESPLPEPISPDEIFVNEYAEWYPLNVRPDTPAPSFLGTDYGHYDPQGNFIPSENIDFEAVIAEQNNNSNSTEEDPLLTGTSIDDTAPDESNPLTQENTTNNTDQPEDIFFIETQDEVVIPAIAQDFPEESPLVSNDNPLTLFTQGQNTAAAINAGVQADTQNNTQTNSPTPSFINTTPEVNEESTDNSLNPLSASLFDGKPETDPTKIELPVAGDDNTSSGSFFLWIFAGAITLLVISFFFARKKKY